jgi:excisionase family DNA binding protein
LYFQNKSIMIQSFQIESLSSVDFFNQLDTKLNHFKNEILEKVAPFSNSENLTSKEVQKLMGISHQTLHTWIKQGKIPCIKIGNRLFFSKVEISSIITSKALKNG